MKSRLLLPIFFLLSIGLSAQEKNKISVFYGFADNDLYRTENVDGAGSSEGKGATLFGLNFQRKITNSFSLETGLEFSTHDFELSPAFYPGRDMAPKSTSVEMLTVPVYGNLTFLKYFFINAGALVDFKINNTEGHPIDDQSGIGFGVGIGGKYNFNNFELAVNPFFRSHSLIPFEKEKYHQHIREIGVKFEVGYIF